MSVIDRTKSIVSRITSILGVRLIEMAAILAVALPARAMWRSRTDELDFVLFTWGIFILLKALITHLLSSDRTSQKLVWIGLLPAALCAGLVVGAIPSIGYARSLNVAVEKLQEISDAVDSLETAVNELESSVDQFSSDNWRRVVPDVMSATGDVVSAFAEVRSATE